MHSFLPIHVGGKKRSICSIAKSIAPRHTFDLASIILRQQQILRFYFGTFVFNIVTKKTPFRFPSCEWNGRSNFQLLPRIKIKAILLLQVNVLTETNMPEKCYVSSWRSFLSQFKDISIIPPNRPDFFLNLTFPCFLFSDHNLRAFREKTIIKRKHKILKNNNQLL